jgi:hypothetical protein
MSKIVVEIKKMFLSFSSNAVDFMVVDFGG